MRNPAWITASRSVVCAVGHWEKGHGSKEITVGKEKVKVCKIYTVLTCEEHFKVAEATFGPVLLGHFQTPMHLWLNPVDNKEMFRVGGTQQAGDLQKDMEKALAMVPGPRVPKADYDSALKSVTDGDAAFQKVEIRKAIEEYSKLVKSKHDKLREWGDENLKKVDAHGMNELGQAQAHMGISVPEAKARMKKIVDDYKPLECSKAAAEALKEAEKSAK